MNSSNRRWFSGWVSRAYLDGPNWPVSSSHDSSTYSIPISGVFVFHYAIILHGQIIVKSLRFCFTLFHCFFVLWDRAKLTFCRSRLLGASEVAACVSDRQTLHWALAPRPWVASAGCLSIKNEVISFSVV